MTDSVILIGGGGHAKAALDCIRSSGAQVVGILDDGIAVGTTILGAPVLGKVKDYRNYLPHRFLIAIGNNSVRQRIAQSLKVNWYTAIHASAAVSPYASIGVGTVVMAHAVINAGATIGTHCIINTGAIVEHDNCIADYVHISPAAALGGTVSVGEGTHVGIGVSVRNNISICGGCTVGAGAAVVKDITVPGTYIGAPARRME